MQDRNRGVYTIKGREPVAEGADLRVTILTLDVGECVPWHFHNEISDDFFCMEGPMVVETRAPRNEYVLRPGEPRLAAPNIKFNRGIGRWAGQKFHALTGEPLDDKAYVGHLEDALPSAKDKKLLLDIIGTEKKWICPKEGGRDPLATIGEPRKSAINL